MRGNAITRRYGAERVRLSRSAVITDRLRNGCGVQLLDSHSTRSINSALGKVTSLRIERGALRAGVKFHETDEAREAIEMLADGEISSVSAAYAVADLEILDCHGRLVDPCDSERSTESDLIFEATRFELYELSLVRGDLDVDTTDLADRAYTSRCPLPSLMFMRECALGRPWSSTPPAAIGAAHATRGQCFDLPSSPPRRWRLSPHHTATSLSSSAAGDLSAMAARIKHLFHEPDGGATIGTRVPDVFQHFGRAARTAAGGISPAAVPAILTALFAGPPRREVFASPRQLAPARTCRVVALARPMAMLQHHFRWSGSGWTSPHFGGGSRLTQAGRLFIQTFL